MFGYWLSDKLYENLPQLFFYTAAVLLVFAAQQAMFVVSACLAFSALGCVVSSIMILRVRNDNRNQQFGLGQLLWLQNSRPQAKSRKKNVSMTRNNNNKERAYSSRRI